MAGRLISKDFLWRVWARADEDEIFGRSAQLSYYFLLALFPLLLFLITLFGYFDGADSHLRHKLLSYLSDVMPSSASHLVIETIDQVTAARGGGKLSFGLLAAIWAASSGMNALGQSLNAAYDVRETRSWWKVRLISIALTFALSTLITSALVIVLYGGLLGHLRNIELISSPAYPEDEDTVQRAGPGTYRQRRLSPFRRSLDSDLHQNQ